MSHHWSSLGFKIFVFFSLAHVIAPICLIFSFPQRLFHSGQQCRWLCISRCQDIRTGTSGSERRGRDGSTRTRRTREMKIKYDARVSLKLALANVAKVRQPEEATLWGRRYISVR